MQNAMTALVEARERLRAIDPTIDDDAQLLADMLEGETVDAFDIIDRLVEASIHTENMARAAEARKMELAERQARFKRRSDSMRAIVQSVLEAVNMRKLERPAYTASLRQIPAPLILDEAALGEEWFRTKREPMKAEIRKELASGGDVEGAQLGNASTGISIRTR
jgi:hypothetical protein